MTDHDRIAAIVCKAEDSCCTVTVDEIRWLADRAAPPPEQPAPVGVTWIVEPFGMSGLTQHRIENGWIRATVRHGYDDHQVRGSLDTIRVPGRVENIRASWFGGMPGREAEYVKEAKDAVLGWAREIGALAVPLLAAMPPDPACRLCAEGYPFRPYDASKRVHLSHDKTHAIGECSAPPPDTAPTGERRPCAGWREHDRDCYLLDLGVVKARVNRQSKRRGIPVRAYIGGLDGRSEGMGEHDDRDTLMLSMEDAAAELLRAGLRALGCK